MKGKWIGFAAACLVLSAWAGVAWADPPPPTLWVTQFGTSEHDRGKAIALDPSGNLLTAGYTSGDLGGPNQGYEDIFIAACDSAGTFQWASQFGSNAEEIAWGIGVDAAGSAYVAGRTRGDLGATNQGLNDICAVKTDSGGTHQWTRQIGTVESDAAFAIAVDGSGNSYITGTTRGDLASPNQGEADAFVVRYDSAGTIQWSRQVGTVESDVPCAIAVDGSGNSVLTGYTRGDLGGPSQGGQDAFILACDSGGTVQPMCQIGTGVDDFAYGIALDATGNIYIAGCTDGDLGGPQQGAGDAFVLRCDSMGTVQWVGQIGTPLWDEARGVAVDGSGNVYITGRTGWELGGPKRGRNDAFVAKFDDSGAVVWIRQFGPDGLWTGAATGEGIVVDGSGNVCIAGDTLGDLGGPSQGGSDAFIMAVAPYSATAGDANLDGCVDGLDYVVWSNNYQTGTWWEEGDFTGDGCVDGLDYIAWSNNYLAGCPAAVPEPASALVLALGLFFVRKRPSD
jgi:hypothetical protein